MTILPPFNNITKEQTAAIRRFTTTAEQNSSLTPEQVELIYEQGWFRILVPKCYGGLELSLPDVIKLEEDLARADGSLGWAVTLCAGAGWFGGFCDPEFARQVFTDRQVCLAGSGAPSGFADTAPGGYNVTGKWMHATGAQHATVFTANCIIRENGVPVIDENGTQKILSFTFLKNEVSVLPGWPFMGMKATSSYIYEVNNVTVPNNRTFRIDPAAAVLDLPLYKYPFRQLAEATLAVNMSGMALHFMELAQQIFTEKKNRTGTLLADIHTVQQTFDAHLEQLNNARTALFSAVQLSWDQCVDKTSISDEALTMVGEAYYAVSQAARIVVDTLYPYCGLVAADPSSAINRVWRDIHTAGQHTLLVFGSNK